ncbi:ComEA family DNA-binding protein [Salisaeta longa]|uniref:ComEA family DNA-binding protein n=1 Tax=Salisaeta longa TaxID=503170 RepID=UPI0003B792B7|nr:helix-hairpin-helix domain-containing protein [Salisaeta longa]
MQWLYDVQHRLSITRREAMALLTVSALFWGGLLVQEAQERWAVPKRPPALYQTVKASGVPPSMTVRTAPRKVNVNTAPAAALERLPEIGPALARRIMRYRAEHNGFATVDELDAVSGIGPKTLATLRPLVVLRDSAAAR